jgi:hypothetical protein
MGTSKVKRAKEYIAIYYIYRYSTSRVPVPQLRVAEMPEH